MHKNTQKSIVNIKKQSMKTRNPKKERSMFFICGSSKNQEQEQDDDFQLLWTTPSPSRQSSSPKNPYSNRGLDKFEALLADLDDKKRKIFTQKGSQSISFVRFMNSKSKGVKPVIVRLKAPRKLDHKDQNKDQEPIEDVGHEYAKLSKKIRVDGLKMSLKRKVEEWWMPSYSLQVFVIMVMVFFTFFGRSLAIICTSIAWYLIPTIDTSLENMIRPKKMIKNEQQYSRKGSEMKVVSSAKPFFSGPINVKKTDRMKKLMSF